MSSLYIDRKNISLELESETLVYYENEQRQGSIPLAPLERIYMRGDISLKANLLGKIGEKGIGIIVLSGRKGEASLMLSRPHNDAARRIAQYQLSQQVEFCRIFTQSLLEIKLSRQAELLEDQAQKHPMQRYLLKTRSKAITSIQSNIEKCQEIASLRGVEGAAASQYFAGLKESLAPSLGFSGRNRRPPKDPVNAIMSLGYTLLHSEAVLVIHGAGLDPYIGFYHALDYGRESLACDLIEILRPRMDAWIIEQFAQKNLREEDFSQTSNGCMLGKAGRSRFYIEYERASESWRQELTQSVQDLIKVIKGQIELEKPQTRSKAGQAEPAQESEEE